MINEFTNRKEVIFIEYIGIIKNPFPFVLKKICEEWKMTLGNYVDLSKIINKDISQLLYLSIKSTEKNVLKYIAKRPFDSDSIFNQVYNKYDNLYAESEMLSIGMSLQILLRQNFIKKVYIYTADYDKRIHLDLADNYPKDKISYITGEDKLRVIKEIKDEITSYITTDISLVDKLISIDKISYSSVLVASYGYNLRLGKAGSLELKIDDVEDKVNKYTFKLASFVPANLTERHLR